MEAEKKHANELQKKRSFCENGKAISSRNSSNMATNHALLGLSLIHI